MRLSFSIFLFLFYTNSVALTFRILQNSNIVGSVQTLWTTTERKPLPEIGISYGIGVAEMMEANPHLDPWDPEPGNVITVPTRFILPSASRKGVVINLAEMRLYYYHKNAPFVSTFPIAIGKPGWPTPLGNTSIVTKREKPSWYVPPSIRSGHAKNGRILPAVVPPGPINPLGEYALNRGFSGYLIHGTIHPGGIGLRSTHGCIRMQPADIAWLFKQVDVGTPVQIIHQPLKIGIEGSSIFLEAHLPIREPLYEKISEHQDTIAVLIRSLEDFLGKEAGAIQQIHWKKTHQVLEKTLGIPELISKTQGFHTE